MPAGDAGLAANLPAKDDRPDTWRYDMRRVAAAALVAVTTSSALIGLAAPSIAAAPASPIDPVVKVVQTAVQEVNTLICELFGNSVLCGAV